MTQTKKIALTIAGIILVALFWIFRTSTETDPQESLMIKFLSLDQLHAAGTSRVKLGGLVESGSIAVKADNKLDCNFTLVQGNHSVPVHYTRTRPDLFKDEAEVIVTGVYEQGIFEADDLQTKCASRYEGDLRDESNYNLKELEI